jgi:hypothetical protein
MNHPQLIRLFLRALSVLVLSVSFPLSLSAQINLYGIGDLAGGDTNSQVRDATRVSGNIVAVGAATQYLTGTTSPTGDTPVKWVQGTGLSALPQTGNSTSTNFAAGRVISSDGTIIGGSDHNGNVGDVTPPAGRREPSVWTNSGATVMGLGYLGNATTGNGAINGLSSDGSVGYGFVSDGSGGVSQAFRYTSSGGMVGLGFLSGNDSSVAAAHAVSSDGTVMMGVSYSSATSGGFGGGSRAFRYNSSGSTMTVMSLLPGGTWNASLALTADGTKAFGVGDSTGFANGQLVSWNSAGVATALGSPNSAYVFGNIAGTTSDGSVFVVSVGPSGSTASLAYFYNQYGWFDFQTAMTNAGVNLTGWTLTDVLGISPDGTLVYGDGTHNGAIEGYVLSLPSGYLASVTAIPEPSIAALGFGAAGLAAVIWRRTKRRIYFSSGDTASSRTS